MEENLIDAYRNANSDTQANITGMDQVNYLLTYKVEMANVEGMTSYTVAEEVTTIVHLPKEAKISQTSIEIRWRYDEKTHTASVTRKDVEGYDAWHLYAHGIREHLILDYTELFQECSLELN